MKIPQIRQLPSGSWFCQLRIDGRSISITESSHDMCEAKAYAYKAGLLKALKHPEAVTVGKAIDSHIDSKSNLLSPSTIKAYKSYRLYRFQGLMSRDATTLTTGIMQSAVNAECKEQDGQRISAKTVRNAYNLVKSSVCRLCAVEWDCILLPAKAHTSATVLSGDDLATLFDAVRGKSVELPVLLAAWLSLRRSEIFGLTWGDIDFKGKLLSVKQALIIGENGKETKATKTYGSTRVIACPDYILDKLKAFKIGKPDELIIKGHPNSVYNGLSRLCAAVGLPRVGLHDLRHTNASVMLALNVPDKYAMARGGWSTPGTMKSIYQHIISADKRRVDDEINAHFDSLVANKDANNSK